MPNYPKIPELICCKSVYIKTKARKLKSAIKKENFEIKSLNDSSFSKKITLDDCTMRWCNKGEGEEWIDGIVRQYDNGNKY